MKTTIKLLICAVILVTLNSGCQSSPSVDSGKAEIILAKYPRLHDNNMRIEGNKVKFEDDGFDCTVEITGEGQELDIEMGTLDCKPQ